MKQNVIITTELQRKSVLKQYCKKKFRKKKLLPVNGNKYFEPQETFEVLH